jgi:hypothetical protein
MIYTLLVHRILGLAILASGFKLRLPLYLHNLAGCGTPTCNKGNAEYHHPLPNQLQ